MRTRRQFRPVFEFLPGRIAPSCAFDVTDPRRFLVNPRRYDHDHRSNGRVFRSLDRSVIGRLFDRDRLVDDTGSSGTSLC